ncbi:Glycosyl transferase, family 2 [Olavius sp. associated proteobacterium Delta 1]|nr:Glycosyl transferase, family 2 [Olavius sp. associated proteobacterium Delta 1]
MANPVRISAVIITFNEEGNIGRCLESVREVADEIVVVDSYSTDNTKEICQKMTVIFLEHQFEGHIEQKNYAVSCAKYAHVLSLDADEILSERLKQSVLSVKQNWQFDGYSFNRLTNYCGKWIRHSGWYPDTKLRLWDKTKGNWGGVNPHDRVLMAAHSRVCHLAGDLHHYSYNTIKDHLDQINSFSEIAARAAYADGGHANLLLDIVMNPLLTFFKKYFLKLGILDGYQGFMIAIHTAYGKFLKYIKLRELEKSAGRLTGTSRN